MPLVRVSARLGRGSSTQSTSSATSVSSSTTKSRSTTGDVQNRPQLESEASFINAEQTESDYSAKPKLETDNKCSVIVKVSSSEPTPAPRVAKENKLLKVVEETMVEAGMDDLLAADSDHQIVDDQLNDNNLNAHEGLRNIVRIVGLPVG